VKQYNNTGEDYMVTRKSFLNNIKDLLMAIPVAGLPWLKNIYAKDMVSSRDLVVVKAKTITDASIAAMVKVGLQEMGGIERFVKRGSKVIIKPNIAFNSTPDRAHTTNPSLVETVARICKNAGAQVTIMDRPVHNARLCYHSSRIEEAAKRAGVNCEYMNRDRFKTVHVPQGLNLDTVDVYEEILEADCIINMPIAKHHNAAMLSLSMKNLMGVIGGNRGFYHVNLHRNIVDFNKAVKVHLIIMDGLRILTKHGPSSGGPEDIKETKTIIFGINPVMVDTYTAHYLFGIEPSSIGYLSLASNAGMGSINVNTYSVITKTV